MEQIFEMVKNAMFYSNNFRTGVFGDEVVEKLQAATYAAVTAGEINSEQAEDIINNPLKTILATTATVEFDDRKFVEEITETMSPMGQRLGTKTQWAIVMAISANMKAGNVDIVIAAVREIYAKIRKPVIVVG